MKSFIVKTMCMLFVVAGVAGAQMGQATVLTQAPRVAPPMLDVPMNIGSVGEPATAGWQESLQSLASTIIAERFELESIPELNGLALAPLVDLDGLLNLPSDMFTAPHAELIDAGDQDDPGYTTYKKGYNLILQEKWEDARKTLNEVVSKYPKSKYVDDAQYWVAYSLKHSDKKKAIEAYKKFLKQYPDSNYYDDAVADLNRLENPDAAMTPEPPGDAESLARAAEELTRSVKAIAPAIASTPPNVWVGSGGRSKERDPELRMKIEALYALGRANQDEKTFELLKETALSREQPRELREAALDVLRNFKGRDITGIYMELINDDSDKRLQQNALYCIGQAGEAGNEKTFSILKAIATDRNRSRELRESAFHSLTQLKRADVMNIFVDIAKHDPDRRIQQSALYYVSQSARGDDEKAFQALKEFALDQKQNREVRESAFHSLKELRRGDVLGVFLEIAKNDPDDHLRMSALYYIGGLRSSEPDKVFTLYKEFLLDQKQSKTVREGVMNSLASLKYPETLNLLLQVAKSDPNEQIQQTAIYYIGQLSKNKSKNLETLISLYDSLPKDQTRSLESVLYAVASIGSDQAVDFLSKVAKTSENYDLRRRAVYYLGNIGGDKARAVLLEILKSK